MTTRKNRINPDRLAVLIFAVLATLILTGFAMVESFHGLRGAGTDWTSLGEPLGWLVAASTDGAMLVYTVAIYVFRQRRMSTKLYWGALTLWTAVSIATNWLYEWGGLTEDAQAVAGATLVAFASIGVLLSIHTTAELVVDDVEDPAPAPAQRRRALAQGVKSAPSASTQSRRDAARDAYIRQLAEDEPTLGVRKIASVVGTSKSTVARVLGRQEPTAESVD
jgi:hypothetical protein